MKTDNVVAIDRSKTVFTLEEVNELIPLLNRIYKHHETIIHKALDNQRFFMQTGAPQIRVTEQDDIVCAEMKRCAVKCYKLGARVLQGGHLGFDSGMFFWSWKFPETECLYHHAYHFATNPELGRQKLEVKAREY